MQRKYDLMRALARKIMAIPSRHADRGAPKSGTFFVTSTTWERRPLFRSDRLARLVICVIEDYRKQGIYLLHAFTVMPDHFHALITPKDSLSRAVQFIKGGSSNRIGKGMAPNLEVWQRGFSDHQIRNGADFRGHEEYIDFNAVERGLAKIPSEYSYCSATRLYEIDAPPKQFAG